MVVKEAVAGSATAEPAVEAMAAAGLEAAAGTAAAERGLRWCRLMQPPGAAWFAADGESCHHRGGAPAVAQVDLEALALFSYPSRC